MRVLHLTTEYPPLIYGGLGTAVGGLVNASADAGLEVAVLLVGGGARAAYDGPGSGSVAGRSPFPGGRIVIRSVSHDAAVTEAIRFARCWKPDIVHVHVFWLAHVATAIRQATQTPLVYTVHSLDRAEYEIGAGPPECVVQWQTQSALIASADRIIALTSDEQRLIADYCPDVSCRIRIVGNGLADTALARAAAVRRHDPASVTILYSGRFVDRKGIRELLEAAPSVLDAFPTARLVLAGGHRFASAADMSRHWLTPALGRFADRISFTGWLDADAINGWYAQADVLVVPSWYEPFGMVILEGMLHGLAIVASNVGGPKAILSHGRTGLLCEPRSAASLAQALLRVVGDRRLRQRLGRRAAREVRTRWLHRQVVPHMWRVYSELAS